MRSLIIAWTLVSACTPVNVSDNRVMSDGKSNGAIGVSTGNGDATPSPGTNPKPAPGDPNPALASFLPVAYTDELEPMMQRLCTESCHQGAPTPGPMALNTSDALKAARAGASAAIDAGRMPPNQASLSATDKKFLSQLSVSLKNWSKNEAYAQTLGEFKITYTPAVVALSTALCVTCHQGDQPSGGLRLDSQDQWKIAMPRILSAIEAGRMPPRVDEVQGPRLIKFLSTWQDQGFP
ncbi:MAG TPA: c-type cytochrome domain-containing protein [Oligoflexus sp.]|uniref:c-type cytochrome domain-containing protein n=1 Tax=Oligoflexus sp. TaxID=1971216 RepID=UPI002D3E1D85|nr:c-type cytochrome domain-containing protein [Oligoflexus sp.]HYX36633.1 c-type cytochrome domain-containing protein [Oligoflexus sp.]